MSPDVAFAVPRSAAVAMCLSVLSLSCRQDGEAIARSAGPNWRLHQPAVFSLAESADDRVVFYDVAESAAMLPRSETLVVANRTARQLIFLSYSGRVQAVRGRPGKGPGEFAQLRSVSAFGNDIIAWDPELDRVSVYSASGQHLRDIPVAQRGARVVGGDPSKGIVTAPIRRESGRPRTYTIHRPDTRRETRSGPAEYPDQFLRSSRAVVAAGGYCLPTILEVVVAGAIYVVDSGRALLSSIDDGGVEAAIYQSSYRLPINSTMIEVLKRRLAESDSVDRSLRRVGAVGEVLKSAWSHAIADQTGRVWLRRATCFDQSRPQLWEIVETTGHLIGVVEVPDHLQVLAVHGDHVVALRRDSLDVEYVGLYEIDRGNSPNGSRLQ